MASTENARLFFLAFILLSVYEGIKADGCPQSSLTSPSMGTYSCPGSNIIYTCVLNSSAMNVITTWSGSVLQCPPTTQISLTQRAGGAVLLPFTPVPCGSLSAVTTNVTSTCYTSVLTIPAVQALNGTTVMCTDTLGGIMVGSDTLKIITSPGPVGNMTVTSPSVDQLTVTWTPPTTGGVPTSYNVTINDSSNTLVPIPTSGLLQHNFTNLTNGTLYTVSVMAINCAGSSVMSKTKWTLALPPDNTTIKAVSVFNPNNTLRHLEITWMPVGGAVTIYGVYLGGGIYDASCTTAQCFYVVSVASTSYVISVASVNKDGDVGPNSIPTIYGTINNTIFSNVTTKAYASMATIDCSFLNNQSFYCMVCCSTDPSVPPDSSVYSISTTRGTEVTVSVQGLTRSQMYFCKAAATNTSSINCTGPVVGGVKVFMPIPMATMYPLTPTVIPTPTPKPLGEESNGAAIGGGIGGALAAVLIIVVIVVVVVVIWKTKAGKGKKREDTVELGKSTPPPAPSDGTGALYQDPNAIKHTQAPGGEVYAMTDKPTKTSKASADKSKKQTATVAPAGT